MRLEDKLRITVEGYRAAIQAAKLTPQEQEHLDEMVQACQTRSASVMSGPPVLDCPLQPQEGCPSEHLNASDLQTLARKGVLPPRPLPDGVEWNDQTLNELDEIYQRAGKDSRMQQLQFFHPSACQALLEQIETFTDLAADACGTKPDDLVCELQVFSSRMPAPLHCDFPSDQLFNVDRMFQSVQFHINLRLPSDTTGLVFFPGTHERIVFPRTAFGLLMDSGIAFDLEVALKSLIIGERISVGAINNLRSDGGEHFLEILDGSGGTQPTFDFLIGMYCTFLWMLHDPDQPLRSVESTTFPDSLNQFITFNPAILHCTEESVARGESPRISIGIRAIRLPDARALRAGPVLTHPWVRWLYRTFIGDDLDKLAESCLRFEDLYDNMPHRAVMSAQEVATALFGPHRIGPDSLVFLHPACADDVKPPFVSLNRLRNLNRVALERLDRRASPFPKAGHAAQPSTSAAA